MKISRRKFLKYAIAGLVAGAAGTGYSTLIEPEQLSLERITVPMRGLPTAFDGFKIAALGDFHLHPFTKLPHIQKAVQLANNLRPDLVVLLGDYVDATAEAIYELAPELSRLNARFGVFGVLGNHDHWKGAKIVQEELRKKGIPILNNAGVPIHIAANNLYLAGLDSAWSEHSDLNNALGKRPNNAPTIVLVHEPDYADRVAMNERVSLQLSGHSHGGQIRLPFIGALELPSWGRRYDCGLYRVRDLMLYTNRGIGLVDIPVRFNCLPEVTEITLVAA